MALRRLGLVLLLAAVLGTAGCTHKKGSKVQECCPCCAPVVIDSCCCPGVPVSSGGHHGGGGGCGCGGY